MATNDHRAGVLRAAEITERVAIGGFMARYTGVEAAVARACSPWMLEAGRLRSGDRDVRAMPVDSVSRTGSPYPI
jgi:hypothetical protein